MSWFKQAMCWSWAGTSFLGPAHDQPKPAAMLQNMANQHMQFFSTGWSVMTIKSNKIVFICLNFLHKLPNLKAETMFHTRSNLLCFVCRRIVSFLFAPQCFFHSVGTWCVVWEHNGLSDKITKGGESLRRVNSINSLEWHFYTEWNDLPW